MQNIAGPRDRFHLPELGRHHGAGKIMDFTTAALLWVPLPIIQLIALFWHH
jgi:hypothetical protein